ncbi:MAG TPA: phosphate ABC transporter permease subunit PstC [Candidatus Limnocylindrales bacterium]|nr:phosphate ABC transporter permease subunit PstC [Candidatus Limnocylindrales bacterium]
MTAHSQLTLEDLKLAPARRRRERVIGALFFMSATLAIVISVAIVLSLLGDTITFIQGIDTGALLAEVWQPRSGEYGLATIVSGTLVIAVIAMLVATPLGLGAAIYLAEYASPRARGWLKPILEILATIPSVVLGFFALTVLSPALIQNVCPGNTPVFTMASAGVAVGILITPLIASISEDAMYAVPNSLREASYGLGASKRTTSIRIVVPAAVSGIVASLIVAFSRAVGETMIVSLAAGGVGGAVFSLNPCLPGQTMTGAMTVIAIGSDAVGGGVAFQSLFFVGLLLFFTTLVLNLISESFVRRMRKGYQA